MDWDRNRNRALLEDDNLPEAEEMVQFGFLENEFAYDSQDIYKISQYAPQASLERKWSSR